MLVQVPGTAEPVPTSTRSPGSEWQWGWALVVLANLPIPFAFGLAVTAKGGFFGMLAGIVALWLAGAVTVARVPWIRRPLVSSAGVFSLSQTLPIAQFMAGGAALELCAQRVAPPPEMTEWMGFLVTVVTGGLLLATALAGGLFFRMLVAVFAGHPHRHPS
ncbi:hypothetical protein R5W23_003052 [Gemmata sp. JC673]|uniref:DUF2062 domain-containing protein n=1 Tax=Gemmata algarum TaxID=2975278 RepID=A0ABU5ET30_9BACT|nr:hypothetical protein [Gemmata algarum]MDY3557787.1 hypothetical protein [Gemmata algarum]